jgi:SAM-dependent methyltransferase
MTDDRWAQARAYEMYMGRWSGTLAARFVDWIAAPPAAHWLDVGCGTGAFSQAILDRAAPASVTGCDSSAGFVAFAQAHRRDPRVRFEVASAAALPARSPGYDVVASNLVLNFLPSPPESVRAMAATTVPGGLIAACVWDYAGGMQFVRRFWDAAIRVDAAAVSLDEARRFPICETGALGALFTSAGLSGVTTSELVIETRFRDFADVWEPMLGGVGPVGTYLAKAPPSTRDAIAHELEQMLPRTPGGGIDLTARALVVSGRT